MERFTVLLFACIMMSCGSGANQSAKNEQNTVALYAKWELVELEGKTVKAERPIYLELAADHKVTGHVGCNRVTGAYEMKVENQIHFENMATTRMTCPEIELEGQVLKVLEEVSQFSLDNGSLVFNSENGASLAVWQQMSDSGIVNKYWKLKTLKGEEIVMSDHQEREQFFLLRSDQTINGFAGCNSFNGQYELKGKDEIEFHENMATTLKACPDDDVDERGFLDVFPAAKGYILEGDDLTLVDDEGTTIATFEAIYF